MYVNPTMPKEMKHSTCELRFLELEDDLKKHVELAKTVRSHAKQLNEMKRKLVSISILKLNVIKTQKSNTYHV